METLKLILQFLLGGSKWPLIAVSVAFLAVGGFTIWKIIDIQNKLSDATLNIEIMKTNTEKLEKAKKEQDKTIEDYRKILETANESNQAIVRTLQLQIAQNDMIAKKLSQLSSKKALSDPKGFEMKVNITMQILNKCFEDLAKKPIAGNTNEITCPLDSIPDFSK